MSTNKVVSSLTKTLICKYLRIFYDEEIDLFNFDINSLFRAGNKTIFKEPKLHLEFRRALFNNQMAYTLKSSLLITEPNVYLEVALQIRVLVRGLLVVDPGKDDDEPVGQPHQPGRRYQDPRPPFRHFRLGQHFVISDKI